MAKNTVWMKVSSDQYELPVAVANTAVELAGICGVTVSAIYQQMSRVRHGVRKSCPYVKVTL